MRNDLILVRGGGDIATGTIHRLVRCGYPVLILETEFPSAIRRYVAFSEAVYEGNWTVEDLRAVRIHSLSECAAQWKQGNVPILVDPEGSSIEKLHPAVVVDAILAKKNMGTTITMAPTVIALGPGFTAGADAHLVIETQRGHQLGRILTHGTAAPNTGIPGLIGGFGKERVIHAPISGTFHAHAKIGDLTVPGQIIGDVNGTLVKTTIGGVLRGILRSPYPVSKGFKLADVDPRQSEQENCFTISDKARCIAGGVLEGILMRENNR